MVFCFGFSTERENDEVEEEGWKWMRMVRRMMKIGDGEEDIVGVVWWMMMMREEDWC
ncbi:hypothetical protein L195_g013300 [Trifolium pratense]|uniref:Uncharacterized protein n=1 Tax=Trifolium pratense TaxID=57577 RepID=A0A2K3PMQ9_TRIPR|nr:hypothetical protein L195_g013300 [Trifolium pratense]